MSKFIDINIVYLDRLNDTRIITPLRLCEANDFESRDFHLKSESLREIMTSRLCPDNEAMKEFLKVKNAYWNPDRSSFSLEISMCTLSECETHERI